MSCGIDAENVLAAAEAILARGSQPISAEIIFAEASKRLIESAFEQARTLRHTYIGAEHLMLAYVDLFGESELLARLHVKPEDLKENLLELARTMPASIPQLSPRFPLSLDVTFNRLTGDEKKTVEDLWSLLRTAVENENLPEVLLCGFLIAKHRGWSAQDTAERIEEYGDRPSE